MRRLLPDAQAACSCMLMRSARAACCTTLEFAPCLDTLEWPNLIPEFRWPCQTLEQLVSFMPACAG